jgi:hypothetical protein
MSLIINDAISVFGAFSSIAGICKNAAENFEISKLRKGVPFYLIFSSI